MINIDDDLSTSVAYWKIYFRPSIKLPVAWYIYIYIYICHDNKDATSSHVLAIGTVLND